MTPNQHITKAIKVLNTAKSLTGANKRDRMLEAIAHLEEAVQEMPDLDWSQ